MKEIIVFSKAKSNQYCHNMTKGRALASRAVIADSFWARLKGLLFRSEFNTGEGLYIIPCNCIHMIGMAFPIDVIFLDRQGIVAGLVESIKPGKISPHFPAAIGALELPAGTISNTGTEIGDLIKMGDSPFSGDQSLAEDTEG